MKKSIALVAMLAMLIGTAYASDDQDVNAEVVSKCIISAPCEVSGWALDPTEPQPQTQTCGDTLEAKCNYESAIVAAATNGGYMTCPTGPLANPLYITSDLVGGVWLDLSAGSQVVMPCGRGERSATIDLSQEVTWDDCASATYSLTITYQCVAC